MRTKEDLRKMQSLPLSVKISLTKARIREWVREFGTDGVYVSFSGGKDSTVLLHIVREMYPEIEAVFVNTGLEYPEIQKFVKTFDNVTILRPKMRFDEVIKKYGYPLISKDVSNTVHYARKNPSGTRMQKLLGKAMKREGRSQFNCEKWKPLLNTDFIVSDKCCDVMKKKPCEEFEKKTGKVSITAMMAHESVKRENGWLKTGCNAFDKSRPQSNPMAFWTEQDVLEYIKQNEIPIASVYGEIVEIDSDGFEYATNLLGETVGKYKTTGCDRTGCIFCGFGCAAEKDARFARLKETHPPQHKFCIGGGEYVDGVWKPSKEGLGMGHVFDELNKIYGEGFIKY